MQNSTDYATYSGMDTMTTQERDTAAAKEAFARALTEVGGGAALARALNKHGVDLTRQAVFFWDRVPLKYVRSVAEITGIPAIEFLPEGH